MARLECLAQALALLVLLVGPMGVVAAQPAAAAAVGQELVVGVRQAPPFAMRDADGVWTGISIDLWRQMAERVGIPFRFQEVNTEQLFAGLANGTLDAAMSGLAITPERVRTADFLQPYFMAGLGVAVPAAPNFQWRAVLSGLLSRGLLVVALGIAGLILLVALVVWLIERRKTPYFGGPPQKGLVCSVTWSAKAVGRSPPEPTASPRTLPGRLLGAGWGAAAVALIAMFTAAVTTAMSARELAGLVRSEADLHHVRVGAVSDARTTAWLDRQGIPYVSFATPAAALHALTAGDLDAVVYNAPILAWTVQHDHVDAVRMLPLSFDPQRYAIALPPDSRWRQSLNVVLLEVTQTDWWQQTKQRYLGAD